MSGYKTPGKTQTTNINNHRRIRELLSLSVAVEILALPNNVLLHYGQFHLNLAAALEDAIIRAVDPEWNGGTAETEVSLPGPQATESPAPIVGTFSFTLQPSYYRTGFFNVGVSAQKFLGADGETIELFVGNAVQPILGSINRRANMNGTPRVMGGAGLRDWFNTECLRDGPRFGCGVVTNCHPPARASEAYRFGQLDRLFQALDVSDSRAERRLRRRKLSRQWQDRRGSTTAPRSSRMQTFAATSAVCKSISFRSARSGLTANSLRAAFDRTVHPAESIKRRLPGDLANG